MYTYSTSHPSRHARLTSHPTNAAKPRNCSTALGSLLHSLQTSPPPARRHDRVSLKSKILHHSSRLTSTLSLSLARALSLSNMCGRTIKNNISRRRCHLRWIYNVHNWNVKRERGEKQNPATRPEDVSPHNGTRTANG